MLQTGPTMLVFFSYLVTLSMVSPMGIGLGMMVSEMRTDDELTVAVLKCKDHNHRSKFLVIIIKGIFAQAWLEEASCT